MIHDVSATQLIIDRLGDSAQATDQQGTQTSRLVYVFNREGSKLRTWEGASAYRILRARLERTGTCSLIQYTRSAYLTVLLTRIRYIITTEGCIIHYP